MKGFAKYILSNIRNFFFKIRLTFYFLDKIKVDCRRGVQLDNEVHLHWSIRDTNGTLEGMPQTCKSLQTNTFDRRARQKILHLRTKQWR